MDQYCVVVCGLQAGASDDASAWLPVAAALKLDQADFARRVVAALPRIVRRNLDQATADRVVQLLQAMHVDARALPDDPQLACIDRAGSTRGPLPKSALGEFIQPHEWYRPHGDTAWLPWSESVDADDGATTATIEPDVFDVDDAIPSPAAADESLEVMPTPPLPNALNDVSNEAPETPPAVIDDEPHRTVPPAIPSPLPAPPTVQQQPIPSGDPEVTEPIIDVEDSAHDDELINPMNETPASVDPDATAPLAQATAEPTVPAPSRTGRLFLLLVLIVLAVWAYRHWMADTHMGASPATPVATHPSKTTAAEQPAKPGRVTPGDEPASAPATSSATASSVATAATTAAPATASSAPTKAEATGTPPAAASARAPIDTAAAAMVPAAPSSAPPASASASAPARPSAAVATSSARPGTSAH